MDLIKANFCSDHLTKFDSKLRKFLKTQNYGFDQISYYFISFMTETFCSAQISQLPN